MFITAPIWPCARRLIHTNRPMISTSGSTHSRMSPRMLLPVVDVVEVDVLLLERLERRCRGGRPSGPSSRTRSCRRPGSLNSPLMSPVDLLNSMLLTLPSSTAFRNSRVREVGLRRAAAGEAADEERGRDQREHDPRHPAQRRRAAATRRGSATLGRRSVAGRTVVGLGWAARAGAGPGRHDGGGVGGRPLGRSRERAPVSPASGSTPGSRSVWRRLILGRLLVVGRPCYGPDAGPTEREARAGACRGLAGSTPPTVADSAPHR